MNVMALLWENSACHNVIVSKLCMSRPRVNWCMLLFVVIRVSHQPCIVCGPDTLSRYWSRTAPIMAVIVPPSLCLISCQLCIYFYLLLLKQNWLLMLVKCRNIGTFQQNARSSFRNDKFCQIFQISFVSLFQ